MNWEQTYRKAMHRQGLGEMELDQSMGMIQAAQTQEQAFRAGVSLGRAQVYLDLATAGLSKAMKEKLEQIESGTEID